MIVDLMMGDTIKIAKVSEGFNKLLSEEIIYGAFSEEGELASIANTNAVDAPAWIISSVQTSEKHRRQGFARIVMSAITRHMVDEVGRAVLFVDSGNEAAQALYRQIGYRVIETSMITGLDVVQD